MRTVSDSPPHVLSTDTGNSGPRFPNTHLCQTQALLASESIGQFPKFKYLVLLLQILIQELCKGPRNLCFTKFPRVSVVQPSLGAAGAGKS